MNVPINHHFCIIGGEREERGEREVEREEGWGRGRLSLQWEDGFLISGRGALELNWKQLLGKKNHLQNASYPNFHSPPTPPPSLLIFSVGPSRTMQFVVFIHISEINGSLVLALKIFSSAEPLSAKGDK